MISLGTLIFLTLLITIVLLMITVKLLDDEHIAGIVTGVMAFVMVFVTVDSILIPIKTEVYVLEEEVIETMKVVRRVDGSYYHWRKEALYNFRGRPLGTETYYTTYLETEYGYSIDREFKSGEVGNLLRLTHTIEEPEIFFVRIEETRTYVYSGEENWWYGGIIKLPEPYTRTTYRNDFILEP